MKTNVNITLLGRSSPKSAGGGLAVLPPGWGNTKMRGQALQWGIGHTNRGTLSSFGPQKPKEPNCSGGSGGSWKGGGLWCGWSKYKKNGTCREKGSSDHVRTRLL